MRRNYRIMKFFEPLDKSNRAKGYVRFETRGVRATFNIGIENISNDNEISEIHLFKNSEEKLKIGTINSRKGKIRKYFNIAEIEKNSPIEDYNNCVITYKGKPVLYANLFRDEKVDYNMFTEKPEPKIEAAQVKEEKNKVEEPKEIKAQKTIEIERVKTKEKESVDAKIKSPEKESTTKETKQKNENVDVKVKAKAKAKEKESTGINKKQNIEATKNVKRVDKKESQKHHIYGILENFEELNPLDDKIKGLRWWKINYDERSAYKGFLPFFNQIVSIYYPYPLSNRVTTCQSLMKKYGYYIFGIYEEKGKISKFVYGVPGKFLREEQPYKGVTGFKDWAYKSKSIKGDYGYWLAFINAETGQISDPPELDAN